MANEAHKWKETALTVANGGTNSSSFRLQPWTTFVGLYMPAMDNGDIKMEYTRDDSTWIQVLDPTDGEDLVICASGQDPGFIDISDYVRAFPRGTTELYALRVTCAAQTSGAVTLYLMEAS